MVSLWQQYLLYGISIWGWSQFEHLDTWLEHHKIQCSCALHEKLVHSSEKTPWPVAGDWCNNNFSIGLEYWNYLVSIAFLSHLSELQCSNKSIEWLIAFLFVECEFADRGIEWHLKNSARFPLLSFFWWWWEKNPTLEIPQETRSAQTLIQSSCLYVDVIIRYERSSRCLRIAGALEVSMCLIRDGGFPALRSSGLFLSTTLAALFNEFS